MSSDCLLKGGAVSLEHFKHSPAGRKIAALLASDETIRKMENKSREDRPAVEAIGKDVQARVGTLDNDSKKLVGRWVKEVLAARGWRPARKGRVAAGHLFVRGTIYRRAGASSPAPDGHARLAAARALLAQTPGRLMSSDEFIAERRREFRRDE